MIEVRQLPLFADWLAGLRDLRGRAIIAKRIERVRLGNMGDAKSVGGDVIELRIAFGPGYRVYLTRRGDALVVLLFGGDKGSQARDIRAAQALARELE